MYYTISQIKNANKDGGFYFFSRNTMRFFKSRILPGVYNGRYFVTSERGPFGPRMYTVRRANDDGSVQTHGEFMRYRDSRSARRAAISLTGQE